MVYETKFPRQHSASTVTEDCSEDSEVTQNDIMFLISECGEDAEKVENNRSVMIHSAPVALDPLGPTESYSVV